MATWNAYSNQYWPAEYLLDQQGRIAYTTFGEGNDAATAAAVAQLLGISPVTGPAGTPVPGGTTPELYAGSERGTLSGGEQYGRQGSPVTYPDTGPPSDQDAIQVSGTWVDEGQYLVAASAATVRLRFHADSLYVVAGTMTGQPLQVRVLLDGATVGAAQRGPSLSAGSGIGVTREDLFHLLNGVSGGLHLIELQVPTGFQLYTFTFG
jgi:hypothetical protein